MILGGYFDEDVKLERIKNLETLMNEPGFWDDTSRANRVNQELTHLKKELKGYHDARGELEIILELLELEDESFNEEIKNNLEKLTKEVDSLEVSLLLSNDYDELNCFLEIHPGAGGTESCDWASMLLRMYERFCDQNNYKYEVVDYQKGEEAGIKSVTLNIKGLYAYGYLKCEVGVHRLVRISPFDSNKRRHTSFASVSVVPEFDKSVDIEIKESDLKIDVYHSSGAGGQSVNTSDSAVRITHLPTKIVVTCQVERSQLRNKERAMEMLKSKLYKLELDKKQEELDKVKGAVSSINFGSQIRSYVLEPYTLVKDYRSNYETSAALKVLDGDIMPVIESVLRIKK